MTKIDQLLENNKALDWTPRPHFAEFKAAGLSPVRTLVVTCNDPRCVPEQFFNLGPRDAIIAVRVAGGNVRHALRDILVLDTVVGLVEIAIVHHTDCGTLQFTDQSIRDKLKSRTSPETWQEIENIEFGGNANIEDRVDSVRGDLAWVNSSQLIRDELKKACRGFLFDIKTGKVQEVK